MIYLFSIINKQHTGTFRHYTSHFYINKGEIICEMLCNYTRMFYVVDLNNRLHRIDDMNPQKPLVYKGYKHDDEHLTYEDSPLIIIKKLLEEI